MSDSKIDCIKYDTVINLNVLENSHSRIISFIRKHTDVLDVGCASGILGEFLHREYGCNVVGIDNDESLLDIARSRKCFTTLWNKNLDEQVALDDIQNEFDYIVLGDILEHLPFPELLISKLKYLLKPNGVMIISLPNICHGSIKLNLLNNKFEYTEEGLLDRTHLKFFNIENISRLAIDNQMQIEEFERVFASIYKMEQTVNAKKIPRDVVKFVENSIESWVYQYVFTMRPIELVSERCNENVFLPTESEFSRFRRIKGKHVGLKARVKALFS